MHDVSDNVTLYQEGNTKKRMQDWNYRSTVGMMSYLASTSIPDIIFTFHQCTRFSSCPKRPHEEEITHLGQHLKRSKDK